MTKMATSIGDIMSLEEVLNEKPSLHELCRDVPISTNWYMMGIQLELDVRKLNEIEELPKPVPYKVSKMYELWLDTNPHATRRQITETLKLEVVGQMSLSQQYETTLSHLSVPVTVSEEAPNEASDILQHYYAGLSQALIYPVQVAQLLYSVRCISEITLDEVETLEVSLDKKKTTLLTAIRVSVFSDYRKLKEFATALLQFEETRTLANKLVNEYAQKFPVDKEEAPNDILTFSTDQISYEQCASDILRCHYATLSKSLRKPISVGRLLFDEDPPIISEEILNSVKSVERSQSERRTVLLKAVRGAVHVNHHNLEMFASVLKRFTENVPVANAIFNDYVKIVKRDEVQIISPDISKVSGTSTLEDDSQPEVINKIPVPRSMSSAFTSIRTEFGTTFSIIKGIIKSNPPPLEDLIEYLEDCNPSFMPSLAHCESIRSVLNVVRDKCTLIDINYLEAVVNRFNIEEAKKHIESYKKAIDQFCQSVSVRLCLEEIFPVVATPPSLKYETATFVLNWDPDDYMLDDIRSLLSAVFERLDKWVTIKVIKEGSVIVTCTFPLHLSGSLIAKAQETVQSVKNRGIIRLTISHSTILDEKNQCLETEEAKREHQIMKPKYFLKVKTSMDSKQQQDQSLNDALPGEGDEMISQAQSELTSTVKMQSKISKAKAFVMKQFKSAFKQKKEFNNIQHYPSTKYSSPIPAYNYVSKHGIQGSIEYSSDAGIGLYPFHTYSCQQAACSGNSISSQCSQHSSDYSYSSQRYGYSDRNPTAHGKHSPMLPRYGYSDRNPTAHGKHSPMLPRYGYSDRNPTAHGKHSPMLPRYGYSNRNPTAHGKHSPMLPRYGYSDRNPTAHGKHSPMLPRYGYSDDYYPPTHCLTIPSTPAIPNDIPKVSRPGAEPFLFPIILYLLHEHDCNKTCSTCKLIKRQFEGILKDYSQKNWIKSPGTKPGHKKLLQRQGSCQILQQRLKNPQMSHYHLRRQRSLSVSHLHDEELNFSNTELEDDEITHHRKKNYKKTVIDEPRSSLSIIGKGVSLSEPNLTPTLGIPSPTRSMYDNDSTNDSRTSSHLGSTPCLHEHSIIPLAVKTSSPKKRTPLHLQESLGDQRKSSSSLFSSPGDNYPAHSETTVYFQNSLLRNDFHYNSGNHHIPYPKNIILPNKNSPSTLL